MVPARTCSPGGGSAVDCVSRGKVSITGNKSHSGSSFPDCCSSGEERWCAFGGSGVGGGLPEMCGIRYAKFLAALLWLPKDQVCSADLVFRGGPCYSVL